MGCVGNTRRPLPALKLLAAYTVCFRFAHAEASLGEGAGLSKATVCKWDNIHIVAALYRAPFWPPRQGRRKKASGTLITSAQGQDTTRKVSPRCIHWLQLPSIMEGVIASAAASPTTAGV